MSLDKDIFTLKRDVEAGKLIRAERVKALISSYEYVAKTQFMLLRVIYANALALQQGFKNDVERQELIDSLLQVLRATLSNAGMTLEDIEKSFE